MSQQLTVSQLLGLAASAVVPERAQRRQNRDNNASLPSPPATAPTTTPSSDPNDIFQADLQRTASQSLSPTLALDQKWMQCLVLGYLIHGGYEATARVWRESLLKEKETQKQVDDALWRARQEFASLQSQKSTKKKGGNQNTNNVDADGDAVMEESSTVQQDASDSKENQIRQLDQQLDQQWTLLDTAYQSMDLRKEIQACLMQGNVDLALDLMQAHFPAALNETHPESLHFRLLCQHFIELVRQRLIPAALDYAQRVLAPHPHCDAQRLQDLVALLAYEEPEQSPVGDYLSEAYRQRLCQQLNSTILKTCCQQSSEPVLERLVRHTSVLRECLVNEPITDKQQQQRKYPRWQLAHWFHLQQD